MTIRKKIFLLAGILLALFGIVVGVLAVIQKLGTRIRCRFGTGSDSLTR